MQIYRSCRRFEKIKNDRHVRITINSYFGYRKQSRSERQQDGIEKAKAKGVYKGRPKSIDPSEVQRLRNTGMGASEIARELKIGRACVYRALAG
nr:helix-turn-helix domain-containing protein [Sphingomicrobium astaxanthinifaciens]